MLGDGLNEFETKLLPLLRKLEAAPSDDESMDAILTMLENDYPKVMSGRWR